MKSKDGLEQWRPGESLSFSGFEVKENEFKKEFEHVVKSYVNSSLNESEKKPEYNRIDKFRPKMKKNGKTFQQICVELKGFVPQTKVCRSRKHKSDMAIASRAKDVNFACPDFSCLLSLQLKNGD